jgi:hypothetical protein
MWHGADNRKVETTSVASSLLAWILLFYVDHHAEGPDFTPTTEKQKKGNCVHCEGSVKNLQLVSNPADSKIMRMQHGDPASVLGFPFYPPSAATCSWFA